MIVAAASLAAALVAAIVDPPAGQGSSTTAEVTVVPVDKPLMAKVQKDFDLDVPLPDGTSAGRYGRLGAAVTASDEDPQTALERARHGARAFVDWLVPHQDEILAELIATEAPGDNAARRAVLAAPTRYAIGYTPVRVVADSERSALRGAFLGAVVALFMLALGFAAPRLAPAGSAAARLGGGDGIATAILATAGAALAAVLVAAADVLPDGAYSFFLAGLVAGGAALLSFAFGGAAVRALLVAVAVVTALRGAFLAITDAVYVAEPLLAFNALSPAVIAGCSLAAIAGRLGSLERLPRPLVVGWLLIAAACALDFLTQTVGLTVYAIGLAQYLAYPTFALLAWLVIEPGDTGRVAWLLAGLGTLVAGSIFLEATGAVDFVEAADPEAALGLGAARYGGATGSYLHASMFLGTVATIALGIVLARWSEPRRVWLIAAFALILGGLMLTFSRGGIAIFGAGALLLLIFRPGADRVRLIAVCAAAAVGGIAITAGAGTSPAELGDRVVSGANLKSDPGHELRFSEMREAVDRWRGFSAPQKAFGEGLAATGNARKIASLAPDPTESYVLKLLVETGLVGMLAIGAFLVWGLVVFLGGVRTGGGAVAAGLGAGGVGLTLYSLVFPTLEAQLIALTWWLGLVAVLADRRPAGRAS